DTARPRRGAGASFPRCRCKASTGDAVRRPCLKTLSYSARARARAWRGKWAAIMSVVTAAPGCRWSTSRSGAEALAALGAAAGEDLAAVGGRHARTETVVALALEIAGLVGALGGHCGWLRSEEHTSELQSRENL